MMRNVRFASAGETGQSRTTATTTNNAIRKIRVGISVTRILTWALYASLPLARHVLRRILSGRDQFHCRGRDADHLPGPHLAWSRSEGCQRHQHGRAVARAVWRTVWLSKRTRAQFDYSLSSW